MKICAHLSMGNRLHKFGQKRFGCLNADPMSRIFAQLEMACWLLEQGNTDQEPCAKSTGFLILENDRPVAIPRMYLLPGPRSIKQRNC